MIPPAEALETIVTLIKLGQQIRERYKIYTRARQHLTELDSRLYSSLFVMGVFEKVIRRGLSGLPVRQQEEISGLVDGLQSVFDRLDKQLSRFPHDEKFDFKGKLRWTFGGKRGHEAILAEMDKWRSDLYIVVTAIKLLQEEEKNEARVLYNQLFEENVGGRAVHSANIMDEVLRGSSSDQRGTTQVPDLETILNSSDPPDILKDGDRQIIQSHALFIEHRYDESRSPQEVQDFLTDIQKLSLVISKVDAPSMHILRCKGTIHQPDFERSLLIYELPSVPHESQSKGWTLAQAIADKATTKPTLDVRIRYAVEIATAVTFTHAAGLVHKSIRPENILSLYSARHSALEAPKARIYNRVLMFNLRPYPATRFTQDQCETFLVGFDAARLRDLSAYSEQRPETDTLLKLYHHPERQTPPLNEQKVVRFGIRHDMYSLGIVLFELAMWRRVQKFNDVMLRSLISGSGGGPYELQKRLAELAEEHLGGLMGPKYADAVVCCLKDSRIRDGSDGASGENAIREMFYERVLRQLKGIVV